MCDWVGFAWYVTQAFPKAVNSWWLREGSLVYGWLEMCAQVHCCPKTCPGSVDSMRTVLNTEGATHLKGEGLISSAAFEWYMCLHPKKHRNHLSWREERMGLCTSILCFSITLCFIALHRCCTFFFFYTNWKQEPPPAERLQVSLLWWLGTEPAVSPGMPAVGLCSRRFGQNRGFCGVGTSGIWLSEGTYLASQLTCECKCFCPVGQQCELEDCQHPGTWGSEALREKCRGICDGSYPANRYWAIRCQLFTSIISFNLQRQPPGGFSHFIVEG